MLSAMSTRPTVAPATGVLAQENRAYIAALMGVDLNMTGPQAALEGRLTAELDRGVSRQRVVLELLRSRPSRTVQVDTTYEGLLGQAPTAAQLRTGLATVRKSGDTRALEARIMGSPGFEQAVGQGTRAGFLSALYQVVLNRAPTTDETDAGLKAMAAGVSRAELAGKLIDSRPARTLLIEDQQVGLAGATVGATPREYREMSRPGGLLRVMAVVLASDPVFDQFVSPTAATAPIAASAPAAAPGYPVAPGFDLTSSVQPLALSTNFILFQINEMSAGDDDVPWFATPAGLETYNLDTGAMTQVLAGDATSVSAIDANEAYAVLNVSGGAVVQVLDGSQTTLPALPGSEVARQVSASPDGLVWVLGQSGNLYAFSSATQAWSPLSTDGYVLKTISVGSAANIVALTTSGMPLQYTTAGGFQPDAVPSGTYQAIQATPDGAQWAVQDGFVAIKPSYGTWQLAPVQPPSNQQFDAFAAGSMNRGFDVSYTDSNGQYSAQVSLISIGVVDRQPVPFPTFTGMAEQAYLDLSASVTTAPGGIRSLYDTPGLSWGTIEDSLNATPDPPDIPSGVWATVENQLDRELTDVGAVYGRLDLMETIDTQIQLLSTGALTSAGVVEGLVVHGQDSDSTIQLVLEDLFEAIAGAISDSGIPPVGAVAASLLDSGFSDGISYYEQQNNDPPDQAVKIAYSQLAGAITTIYNQSLAALNTDLTDVVSDYGKLTAVAGEILDGQWPLTNLSVTQVTQVATTAFTEFFYQTLTAAGWQIVYLLNYADYIKYPITQILHVNPYDIYQVPVTMRDGVPTEDVYVMNQLGDTIDLNSPSLGANIPVQNLFLNIQELGQQTYNDFWTSQGDWGVIKHVAGTYS
jgi:hypothetical protein